MEGQANDKALRLLVTGGTGAGSLSLLVADSGPGFTSESSARAFERFFTTKPPGKGTAWGCGSCGRPSVRLAGPYASSRKRPEGVRFNSCCRSPRPRAPRPKRTIAPPNARSQPACSRRDQLDRAHRGWPWTVAHRGWPWTGRGRIASPVVAADRHSRRLLRRSRQSIGRRITRRAECNATEIFPRVSYALTLAPRTV